MSEIEKLLASLPPTVTFQQSNLIRHILMNPDTKICLPVRVSQYGCNVVQPMVPSQRQKNRIRRRQLGVMFDDLDAIVKDVQNE